MASRSSVEGRGIRRFLAGSCKGAWGVVFDPLSSATPVWAGGGASVARGDGQFMTEGPYLLLPWEFGCGTCRRCNTTTRLGAGCYTVPRWRCSGCKTHTPNTDPRTRCWDLSAPSPRTSHPYTQNTSEVVLVPHRRVTSGRYHRCHGNRWHWFFRGGCTRFGGGLFHRFLL